MIYDKWNKRRYAMSNKTGANITLERIKELKGNDSQEVFAQKNTYYSE